MICCRSVAPGLQISDGYFFFRPGAIDLQLIMTHFLEIGKSIFFNVLRDQTFTDQSVGFIKMENFEILKGK